MEKKPMYAVMTTSSDHHHPPLKPRLWVAWASAGVALVALVVAGVTASMAIRHEDRANLMEARMMEMEAKVVEVEGRMVEMEGHMLEVLEYSLAATIPSHDYFDYDGDAEGHAVEDVDVEEAQPGPYEHLTMQRVLRRRRQANWGDVGRADGVDLTSRAHSEGLRLYESLQRSMDTNEPLSPEVTIEVTESPIKPYHRISSLWVPKKPRRKFPGSSLTTRNLVSDGATSSSGKISRRRQAITERRSRTKRLHDSERRESPQQQQRSALSNPNPVSVQFRHNRVKATSRHDGFDAALNSVVPQPTHPAPTAAPTPAPLIRESDPGEETVVVPQDAPGLFFRQPTTEYTSRSKRLQAKSRKRRPRPRARKRLGGGGRRRARSVNTLAHFVASTDFNHNTTTSEFGASSHHTWTPATWMDKVGLNRKYTLRAGGDSVLVKEAGLYYLYAQVLYEGDRFGTGFQVVVDDIPILECTLAQAQPTPSCHTSGASYLPRHAVVKVVDKESFTRPVRSHYNTFFGLLKLMEAPDTAEQLLLP